MSGADSPTARHLLELAKADALAKRTRQYLFDFDMGYEVTPAGIKDLVKRGLINPDGSGLTPHGSSTHTLLTSPRMWGRANRDKFEDDIHAVAAGQVGDWLSHSEFKAGISADGRTIYVRRINDDQTTAYVADTIPAQIREYLEQRWT